MRKSIGFTILLSASLSVFGCASIALPKSESELVNGGQSVKVVAETDFVTAFSRLKPYVQKKCVSPALASSNLDRERSKATLIGRSDFGGLIFRLVLTPTDDGKTQIHYTYVNTMVGTQKTLNTQAARYKWAAENYQQGDRCDTAR